MSDPVLEASDLIVTRGDQRVLDGVSLSVDPGRRVLIQGESGVGKSTLFEVLGLLEPPGSGTLEVGGTDASDLPERARARLRRETVGIVFQNFQLVPDLTARENVALPQEHAGERDDAYVAELLGALGVADRADAYPAALSGGEKQRVATARALANRPSVVLADEPTGELDPATTDRLVELLLSVQADAGVSLVVTSHDPLLADRFRRVLRLEDGTLQPSD